jgi:hypothetical protein
VRRSRWTLGLVAVAGCAQLFGLDKTSGTADAPPDAAPSSSLTILRYSIGSTIVQAPQDVSGLTAAAFFNGSAALAGTVTGSDFWSVPATSTSVDYFLPDFPTPIQRTFELPYSDISTLFGVFEHPSPTAAPGSASFAVSATLPSAVVAGESFQVLTVGSWTDIGLTTPVAGATTIAQTYPFTSANSLTGRPLEAITTADTVLLLRFDADALSGFLVAPSFDQATTPAASITGTMMPVPASQTLTATIGAAAATARMGSATPPPTATSLPWNIIAEPGWPIAGGLGVQLRATAAGGSDTAINASYGFPFGAMSWHPVFTWAPTGSRTATVATGSGSATLPVTMFSQLAEFTDLTGGSAVTADLPAAQPLVVTLDGNALTKDGAAISLDVTQRLVVTFTTDTTNATLYQLNVFQLVPNSATAPTALVYKTILGSSALVPSFTLPANLLAAGQSYVIRAVTVEGAFPNMASGDFTTRSLPFSHGLQDAAAFRVVAQ